MHLQLPAVRVGELAERLPISGSGPGDQVCGHLVTFPSLLQLLRRATSIDTGRNGNWAVHRRPISRPAVVCTIDASQDPWGVIDSANAGTGPAERKE
jgi:hypothetical protein